MMKNANVLIASSSSSFSSFVSELLNGNPRGTILGSAANVVHAVQQLCETPTDVVTVFWDLSNTDGLGLLEQISEIPSASFPKMILIPVVNSSQALAFDIQIGAFYFLQTSNDLKLFLTKMKLIAESKVTHNTESELYTAPLQNSHTSLVYTITNVLHELGIPAHVNGHMYLREAILLSVEDMEYLSAITKRLYPALAKRFHTTPTRVERAICRAIEVGWNRGNIDIMQQYFGYTISNVKGKPTNSEFIAMIADKLQLQFKNGENAKEAV